MNRFRNASDNTPGFPEFRSVREGRMKVTIVLKNGQRHEFENAAIQKKDNGRYTAVYDSSSFRIIAEFKAEQISMCQSSKNRGPVSRAVGS